MKILIQIRCNRTLTWFNGKFELMWTQGAGKKEGRALADPFMPNMTLHVSRLGIFTETVEPRPVISAIYRDKKEKVDHNMLCPPFF